MRSAQKCLYLASALFLAACADDLVSPDHPNPSFTTAGTENADLVTGEWDLPYEDTRPTGAFGWLPAPYDQYGIDLPAGNYDLQIEVSGGGVLTDIWSLRYAHLDGLFIGPGGADPGPYPYFTGGQRIMAMVLLRVTSDGRQFPIGQAPGSDDRSVSATVRVKGNARYMFSRGWGGEPLFPYSSQERNFQAVNSDASRHGVLVHQYCK